MATKKDETKPVDDFMVISPIKKITMGKIGLEQAILTELAVKQKDQKFIPIAKIVGSAQHAKPEESDDGKQSWLRFRGVFKAVNIITGEESTSGVMILPGVAEGVVAMGLLGGSEEEQAKKIATEFALVIGIEPVLNSKGAPYEFRCKSFGDNNSDAFSRLLGSIDMKQIAA